MTASGFVQPDYYSRPDWSVSFGDEVSDLAELVGFEPYPEQRMLLDDMFAVDPVVPNRAAAFEVAVVAARQQLKTGLLKQAALAWLFLFDVPLTVWSAHEFATAIEAQQDIIGLIDGCADLSKHVRKVTVAAGQNAIELRSGARLIFRARTSGGGRGLTGDRIILDEAFALQPMHLGALLPTLTSVPDPQIVYGSSAGLLRSDVLRAVRDRGRVGSERLAYAEWLADRRECESQACSHKPGVEGCALDDRTLWAQSCFVSARRDPELETVASLRRSLPSDEFAREMLGWWDDPAGDGVFQLDRWDDLAVDVDDLLDATDEVVFGVDVSPGHDWSAIVAGSALDERVLVELTNADGVFDHRPGMDWLSNRIRDLAELMPSAVFAFAAGSGFEALVPELERDGIALRRVLRRDVAAACGYFMELVQSGRLAHLGQDDLTESVMAARTKTVGESAVVWVRSGLADLSPTYAASLAAWQVNVGIDPAQNVH